ELLHALHFRFLEPKMNPLDGHGLIENDPDLLFSFAGCPPAPPPADESRLDGEGRIFRCCFDRSDVFEIEPGSSRFRSLLNRCQAYNSLSHTLIIDDARKLKTREPGTPQPPLCFRALHKCVPYEPGAQIFGH